MILDGIICMFKFHLLWNRPKYIMFNTIRICMLVSNQQIENTQFLLLAFPDRKSGSPSDGRKAIYIFLENCWTWKSGPRGPQDFSSIYIFVYFETKSLCQSTSEPIHWNILSGWNKFWNKCHISSAMRHWGHTTLRTCDIEDTTLRTNIWY